MYQKVEMNRCAVARINRLTPITCLPLAAKVHMLDEPSYVIEDVQPVAPAAPAGAKHVFFSFNISQERQLVADSHRKEAG